MPGIEPTKIRVDTIYSKLGKYGFPQTEISLKFETESSRYEGTWVDSDNVQGVSDGDIFRFNDSDLKPSEHPELSRQLNDIVTGIFKGIEDIAQAHKDDDCNSYNILFNTEYLDCEGGLRFEYNSTATKNGYQMKLWELSGKPKMEYNVGLSFSEGKYYAAHVNINKSYMTYAQVNIYGAENPHFKLFDGIAKCMNQKIVDECKKVYETK